MQIECVISSVLSHHDKDLKRQTSVTARLQPRVLFGKQRIVSASTSLRFLFLYVCLLLPDSALCKLGLTKKGACWFHLSFSLWSLNFSFVPFHGLFLFFVFQPPLFWTHFPHSNCLTFPPQEMGGPNSLGIGALRSLWLLLLSWDNE